MAERPATNERIEYLEGRVDDAYAKIQASGLLVKDQNPSFVFQPGGPAGAPSNVFTTQPALKAALQATQGERWVLLDGSFNGGTVTLAADTWSTEDDINVIALIPPTSFGQLTLTVTGPIAGIKSWANVAMTYAGGATPFYDTPAGAVKIVKFSNFALNASSAPLYQSAQAGSFVQLNCAIDSPGFFVAANVPLINTSAAGFVGLEIGPNAFLGNNVVAGPAASYFGYLASSAQIGTTQVGLTGGTIHSQLSIDPVAPQNQTLVYYVRAAVNVTLPANGVLQTVFPGNTGMLACAQAAGSFFGPKTIEIETNAAATCPAGTYNLSSAQGGNAVDSTVRGQGNQSPITIQDGAVWLGVETWSELDVTSQAAPGHANATYGTPFGQPLVVVLNDTIVTQTGGGDFISAPANNTTPIFRLQNDTEFVSGTCLHITSGGGAQTAQLTVDSTSVVQANTIIVDAGTTLNVIVLPGGVFSSTQTVAGTMNVSNVIPATATTVVSPTQAQAANAAGDLYAFAGPGVAFTSKTGKVRVNFSAAGTLSNASATCTVTLEVSAGGALAGNVTFESGAAPLAATDVTVSGETIATVTPGTAFVYRGVWGASAGTFAPKAMGNLILQDIYA